MNQYFKKKNIVWGVGGLLILLAVYALGRGTSGLSLSPFKADPNDFKNISFQLERDMVTLVKGEASFPAAPGSAEKVRVRYFGNEAQGDLNNDSFPDKAFLIVQDGAGTGVFYYVVAALGKADGYDFTQSVFVGDRISPQSTEIRDNFIIVNYGKRALPGEETVGASTYFIVSQGKLFNANK